LIIECAKISIVLFVAHDNFIYNKYTEDAALVLKEVRIDINFPIRPITRGVLIKRLKNLVCHSKFSTSFPK
jgi:hypothetical protein